MAEPDKLRIPHVEGSRRFNCVGRLPDGIQFMAFVTGAFPTGLEYDVGSDWQHRKSWLAVIHRFDADGQHLGSESKLGAFERDGRQLAGYKAFGHLQQMFAELCSGGRPEFCDICVRLFSVEIDGVTYGLFYEQSEEEPEEGEQRGEWVMLRPQDVMFHPPWDSGDYST